jgi:hypothetical protein
MLRRIAVGGILAWMMVTALATAPAEGSTKTLLKGKTAQKRVVRMRVWGHALQIVRFSIELKCRDGSLLIDEESGFVRTPIRRNGSFGEVQTGSTDTVMIRGHVKGKAIHGSLRVKDRLGKSRCDSRWVGFTAQP